MAKVGEETTREKERERERDVDKAGGRSEAREPSKKVKCQGGIRAFYELDSWIVQN